MTEMDPAAPFVPRRVYHILGITAFADREIESSRVPSASKTSIDGNGTIRHCINVALDEQRRLFTSLT